MMFVVYWYIIPLIINIIIAKWFVKSADGASFLALMAFVPVFNLGMFPVYLVNKLIERIKFDAFFDWIVKGKE